MYKINKVETEKQDFHVIEVSHHNIKVTFMDYGAAVLHLFVPDKDGHLESVLVAYDKLDSYIENDLRMNAIIGPTAGRIQNAEFTLNGKEYQLDKNFIKKHNLHGGKDSFACQVFDFDIIEETDKTKVVFTYHKKAETSNYPGNQTIVITYTVQEGELLVEYEASTDEDTLLNMTQHMYFNLSGNIKRNIQEHIVEVHADRYVELDKEAIPTTVKSVEGTNFDYRKPRILDQDIDDPFVLSEVNYKKAQVILKDETSAREMRVYTTYPCIVIYTHLNPNETVLLYGEQNTKYQGVCFEAQYVPNGIHIEDVDSAILKRGETYSHKTRFEFK